ncbi:hypothetical protein Esti_005198 [Eimeria stiedai]
MERREQEQQEQGQAAAAYAVSSAIQSSHPAPACAQWASVAGDASVQGGPLPVPHARVPRGKLLIWSGAAGASSALTAPGLPGGGSAAQQTPEASKGAHGGSSPQNAIVVDVGTLLRQQHPPLQLHLRPRDLQKQSRPYIAGAALLRHLLLAQEAEAEFFSPSQLPLLLHLICHCDGSNPISKLHRPQQKQLPAKRRGVSGGGHTSCEGGSKDAAAAQAAAAAAATGAATAAGAYPPAVSKANCSSHFVLALLWAAASWRSRLTEPLPLAAAAAAAALGLRSKAAALAQSMLAADAASAAAAVALAGGVAGVQRPLQLQPAVAAACLPANVCPRLAAIRAVAYWCCCCTLAQQQYAGQQQRRQQSWQQRQQRSQQLLQREVAASGTGMTSVRSSGGASNNSATLLRQLQGTCKESFLLLLRRQQEAQQQLAERQGIEMEAACALREKQQHLLQAAAAPRCTSVESSEGLTPDTALIAAPAAAAAAAADAAGVVAAALEASEKELEELVLQHVSECELLERHWTHEQQLLRQQQLRLFKDVAADLYLLQHCPAVAAGGSGFQQLVLPPLPSADETDKWAFNWQQKQQQQQQPQQDLMQEHEQQQLSGRQRATGQHVSGTREEGRATRRGLSSAMAAAAFESAERRRQSNCLQEEPASSAHPLAAARRTLQRQQQQQPQCGGGGGHAETAASEAGSLKAYPGVKFAMEEWQQQQQQRQQYLLQSDSLNDVAASGGGKRQQRRQEPRHVAAKAADCCGSKQGPVFDMTGLLHGIAETRTTQQQQQRQQQQQQQQQLRRIGGIQEHAQVRLMFGSQQRRAVWLHICTGLLSDFFPSAPTLAPAGASAATPAAQQQQQQQHGGANLASAGQWLSVLARGASERVDGVPEGPLGAPKSYCYKDVRDLRGSPCPAFAAAAAAPAAGAKTHFEEAGIGKPLNGASALAAQQHTTENASTPDLFAALTGEGFSGALAGALLPTGAALQESCACIRAATEVPDLLLPSLEEQRHLLRATVRTARQTGGSNSSSNSNSSAGSKSSSQHNLPLQPGDLFVSRHATGTAAQVCFHLVVAAHASLNAEKAADGSPARTANSQSAQPLRHSSSRSSNVDESAALSPSVCRGLRQTLRLCDKHGVRALLLPLLLLESEASASCLPFVHLQRRVLAVLRCLVAELRAIALSPENGSLCPDASASRLKNLVLLLPPMQMQQQQRSSEGGQDERVFSES